MAEASPPHSDCSRAVSSLAAEKWTSISARSASEKRCSSSWVSTAPANPTRASPPGICSLLGAELISGIARAAASRGGTPLRRGDEGSDCGGTLMLSSVGDAPGTLAMAATFVGVVLALLLCPNRQIVWKFGPGLAFFHAIASEFGEAVGGC